MVAVSPALALYSTTSFTATYTEELPGTPGHDVVDLVVAKRPSERRDPHPAGPRMIVQEHRTPMLEIALEGSRQLARQRHLERRAVLHLGTVEPQNPDFARALEMALDIHHRHVADAGRA